jgi:hypothetical protein
LPQKIIIKFYSYNLLVKSYIFYQFVIIIFFNVKNKLKVFYSIKSMGLKGRSGQDATTDSAHGLSSVDGKKKELKRNYYFK